MQAKMSHSRGKGKTVASGWLCWFALAASSFAGQLTHSSAQYGMNYANYNNNNNNNNNNNLNPFSNQQQQATSTSTSSNSNTIVNSLAPAINPFSFNQNVQENQRAIVICTTSSGELPVNFSWLKDGQLLSQQVAQVKRIQIKNDQDSSTLKISTVRLDHAGNYTCTARNKHGSQSYQAQLLVHGEPRWLNEPPSHEPLVATRGQTVVIDCQTTGWPKPQQSWQIKSEYFSVFYIRKNIFQKEKEIQKIQKNVSSRCHTRRVTLTGDSLSPLSVAGHALTSERLQSGRLLRPLCQPDNQPTWQRGPQLAL